MKSTFGRSPSCSLFAAALLLLLAVLAVTPHVAQAGQAEDLYAQAVQKAQWFDWEGSIPLLDRAIELKPDFADAWHQRGLARQNLKQHEAAIDDFSHAIELNPKNAEFHFDRGSANSSLGNLAKAIADFGQAIQLNPEHPAAVYFARGEAQLMLGENAKAISDLTEAIRLQPDDARAHRSRGLAYAADGQNEKAIEDYRKVVELDPTQAQDWHNLGVVNLRAGQYDAAIEALSSAVRVNPQRDNSYYSRANAYLDKGDRDSALADFSKVIELNPQKADAWGRRGLILLEQGHEAAARRDLDRCFDLSPETRSAYLAAADEIVKARQLAGPQTQPAASTQPEAPQTLEQAVRQYEAAARAGDVERIGELYYEPMATPYRELFVVLTDVGAAKRRLAKALDVRFGRQAINLPLVDDVQVRNQLRRMRRLAINKQVQDEQGYVLGMEITEANASGFGTSLSNQTFIARQQDGTWKIGPYRSDDDVRLTQRTAQAMREIPAVLDRITAGVEAGKYVSRYDAEQAALVAVAPILGTLKPKP